ncbi:MAG: sugar isomerase domain-containing protein [Firmicutes bacterium]|nr:sugar isomerase domain-containing protein [Bacillota bacterium]
MTHHERMAEYVENHLKAVWAANQEVVPRVAARIVTAHLNGHRVYAFGSGHSHMLVEEMYYRAGGLTVVTPIWEPALMLHEDPQEASRLEQTPGVSETILARVPLQAGDVLWLISNSGRNPLIVELALAAKAQKVYVIALTSLNHARAVTPRSVTRDKLHQLADAVLDNAGDVGDAGFRVEGVTRPMFPTSTIAGAVLVHWVWVEVARQLAEAGHPPDVLASFNVDEGLIR